MVFPERLDNNQPVLHLHSPFKLRIKILGSFEFQVGWQNLLTDVTRFVVFSAF